MANTLTNSREKKTKEKTPRAVIDQPGLKIIFVGILISVFLGLSINSQITSQKVSNMVKKSLAGIGPGLQIDFEQAEVKLSDWGIPKPYIIVNQVRIRNNVLECSQNQIYIDKLVVPLTFNLIFSSIKVVDSLRLNRVEVRLGSTSQCKTAPAIEVIANSGFDSVPVTQPSSSTQVKIRQKTKSALQTAMMAWRNDLSARLNEVRIDLIKIIQEDDYSKNFEFRNALVQFEYKDQALEKVNAQSQLVGLFDQHTSSFKLRADLQSEIAFTQNKFIGQLSLKGKIIDRDITAMAQLDSDVGLIKISSSLKNIPVKIFADLFNSDRALKNSRTKGDFQGQASYELSRDFLPHFNLTGEFVADFNVYEKKWLTMQLSSIVIKSSDSSIELNYFDYLKWLKDERYKVQLVIVQLNLDQIYSVLTPSENSSAFQNLGFFSGTFEIGKNFESNLTGILRNSSIVFSNKNKRKVQKITSMNVKSSILKNVYQLKLSDITIENQKISGQIDAKWPFSFVENRLEIEAKNLQIVMSLKGRLLSSEIEQLMFGHPQTGDLVFKFNSSNSVRQVLVTTDDLKFENLEIKKVSFVTELDLHYRPYLYRLNAKAVSFLDPEVEKNNTTENFYFEFMREYFNQNESKWPISAQNLDVKYFFGSQKNSDDSQTLDSIEDSQFDNFQLSLNSFLFPKKFIQFRQTGKMTTSSIWQVENVLKVVDTPAMTTRFVLDSRRSSFEKVQ
jgi:hypothetical protein